MSDPRPTLLLVIVAAAAVAAGGGCSQSRGREAGPRGDGAPPADGDAAPAAADAAPVLAGPVANLIRAEGDVRWRGAGAATWAPAKRGIDLRPSDAVQTMATGLAALRFIRTGALARLGPSTTLRVPDQAPEVARLRHLRGPLVARLGGGEDPQRMEVELPAGTLVLDAPAAADAGPSAPGDEPRVEAHVDVSDERTEVAMLKGVGTLSRERGEPLRIEEEHFVEVRGDGELLDSGRIGPMVVLQSPDDGATVRTRRDVKLAWRLSEGVEQYRVVVTPEGGGAAMETKVRAPRAFAKVELPSGRHLWKVHAIVAGTEARAELPWAVEVDLDVSPPLLELSSPAPGASVRGAALTVAGRTEPGAVVSVDGRAIAVGADGAFSVAHPVPRGLVNIVVRATDDLGNSRAVSRAVLRQ